jgi:MFS family permease
MLCSAVLLTLMGLAPSPVILLVLRMVQGGLSGTVFAAQALVAATSPEEEVTRSMGYLQMGVYVGATMGPIGGGAVAQTLGYRAAFVAAGILLATGGAVVFALVRDPKRRTPRRSLESASRPSILSVLLIPAFTAALIFTLIVQLASTAMLPLIPLYVQELLHSGRNAAADTGWLMALSGLSAAVGSYWCGRLSRHIGLKPLLLSTAVLSAALIAPQAFAGSFVAFLLMRAVAALAFGALWSLVGAWSAFASPRDAKGAAFGLVGAASSLGFGTGPLLGGVLAAATGIRPVFLISACLVGLMPVLLIGLSSLLPALHGMDGRARVSRRLQPEAE